MTDVSNLPPDDQQAIGKTLLTLLASFRNRDAEALHAVYSDDADWVNAFGTVERRRQEIVDYLGGCSPTTTSTEANPKARPRPASGC